MQSPRLSIAKNLFVSPFNISKDKKKFDVSTLPVVSVSEELKYNRDLIKRFNKCVEWQADDLAPTFPYALLTHLHFILVNDKNFPFNPFGLIHKKEVIECFAPLKEGRWIMNCRIDTYRQVDRGYEMDIISELTINEVLVWKSTTTAFKKTRSGVSGKRHDPIHVNSDIQWKIKGDLGLTYGLISNNIDPIHLSGPSARLMGHKRAIIHGMWTVARGLSEYKEIHAPYKIEVKFISPLYIPADVLYKKEEKGFGVYSSDGARAHLVVEINGP